jgi:hypothetical protein
VKHGAQLGHRRIANAVWRTHMDSTIRLFRRCMMDAPLLERRRLLRFLALGSVAVPAMAVAGCASGGGRRARPPQFGGNNDKPGNGGGFGGQGSGK